MRNVRHRECPLAFRSLSLPSPRFAGLPSPPSFSAAALAASARSPRRRPSPTHGRHGRGAEARPAAGAVARRRQGRAGRRIWLGHLPALRRLRPRGLAGAEGRYIDTGKVHFIFREFSRNPLDVAAFVLARCVGDDKAFATIDLLFASQDKWAFVDKPLEPLIAALRPTGLTHDKAMECLKDQKLSRRDRRRSTSGDDDDQNDRARRPSSSTARSMAGNSASTS